MIQMLWAFFRCWRNNPHQRFGQLVSNTTKTEDPFHNKDSDFLDEWRWRSP